MDLETISEKIENKLICCYMTNGTKLMGRVVRLFEYGILLKNPVLLNTATQVTKTGSEKVIHMTSLFDGLTNQEINLIPSNFIMTYVEVIDYIEKNYEQYLEEVKETKQSFLTSMDSMEPQGTIH